MSLFIVSGLLLAHVTNALCSHGNLRIQDAAGFPKNIGVTSLLAISDSGRIVAGTKSGKIFCSGSKDLGATPWVELEGYDSKFPIFSLAACTESLFCGGGDRFISVWQDHETEYSLLTKLGPHTGWVKALEYEKHNQLLYSIGCNCIETWDCRNLDDICHLSKRSIENCPEQGSTLSSDLLSLCLLDDQRQLLSGGVDGRVHVWSSDTDSKTPLYSATVHDGRVNRLLFSAASGLVFSIGNDGQLVAFEVENNHSLAVKAALHVEGLPRLTAGLLVNSTTNKCELALGTADGRILFVAVVKSDNSDMGVVMEETQQLIVNENAMVYALEKCHSEGGMSIIAGHAEGLAQIIYCDDK
jgi:WD40 repeat protein